MDNETQIGTQFRQNCATEGCNDYYLIVSEYYPVPSTFKGDSCIEVYKTVYAVYNAKDELVKEIECNRYSAYHQDVVTSYELYEDSICCKDGYYIIRTCQDCKKEINRWPDAGYYGIIKTNETLTLPSGGTYEITLCSCLCGCINYIEDPYGYAETSETEPVQVTHHGYNCFTKTVKTYTFYENGYDTPFATRTVEIYSESHDIVDDGNGREYCKNCNYKNYDVTTTDSHGRTTEYLRLRVSCTGKIMSHQHWGYNYISSDSCQGYYGYCNGNCDEGLQWSSHTETRHTVEQYVHELGTCTQPSVIREKCKICTEYSNLNEWYYYRDENGYNWSAGHNWTNTDDGSEFEYVCERCGLFSNQGSSYTCLEDLTNHEGTYSKENMFAIGYLKHRYSSTKPYVAFSFVDKDMNYTEEGATITVGSIFAEYEHKEDYIYGYYTHCGHGVIYFDKDSVLESIQLLIDNNVVDMTVDEFLAAYDLAVTVQENETVDYEKNDGYYSVIVLEDLASYFTAE